MRSPVQTFPGNSTQLLFYNTVNMYSGRIRETPVHLVLLIRLTGHLISNLVVSASRLEDPPGDYLAELMEGFCHLLPRHCLSTPS